MTFRGICKFIQYSHHGLQKYSCRAISTSVPLLNRPSHLQNKTYATPTVFQEEPENTTPKHLINTQLDVHSPGRLFAVVCFQGKQRKVTVEDILVFERQMECKIGDRIRLHKVLILGSKDFSLVGRPVLSPELVKVEATVIEKTLRQAQIHFWYTQRTRGSQRMFVTRRPFVYLRIDNIELNADKLPDS